MPAASRSKRRLSRAEKWLFASPLLLLLLIGSGAWMRDAFTLQLHAIAFAPDGTIWSAYRDTSVSVRDGRTGQVLRTLGASRSANSLSFALSPDGKKVVMQGDSPTQIEVRDTSDGHLLSRANTGFFAHLHFSPNGTLLASDEMGCSVSFFDGRTGNWRNTLTDNGFFSQVLLRDRNTAFASLNTLDEHLRCIGVRDTRTGAWIRVWKRGGPALDSLAASRDGRWVAASSDSTLYHPHDRPDGIMLFDAHTGRQVRSLFGKGVFSRLAFSPDGTRLAAAPCETSSVRVWDVATGRELFRVEHPTRSGFNADKTVSLAWSPAGNRLATASADDVLRLWDGHTGAPQPSLS